MSAIISVIADEGIRLLSKFANKSTVIGNVAGATVTVGGIEQSFGTLSGFYAEFAAAVKAKNYGLEAELGIDEALTIAAELGVPYAGLGATLLPFLFSAINNGAFSGTGMNGQPGTSSLQGDLEDRFESGKSRDA